MQALHAATVGALVPLCSEGRVSLAVSIPSAFHNLPASSSTGFPVFWGKGEGPGFGGDIPFIGLSVLDVTGCGLIYLFPSAAGRSFSNGG